MLRCVFDTCRAAEALAPLELTAETEAQWQQLAKAALAEGQLGTAERCYAALGDVAKARYLQQVGTHTWSCFSAFPSLSTLRHSWLKPSAWSQLQDIWDSSTLRLSQQCQPTATRGQLHCTAGQQDSDPAF